MTSAPIIHELPSERLSESQIDELKQLMAAAFADDQHGGFTDDDWQHALGGTHFIAMHEGRIVAHASVVARDLHVDGVPIRTGYVEAVATLPQEQRHGYGSAIMRAVNDHIESRYDLGALGTGSQGFYERLGWRIWRGPSYVRTDSGLERTPEEDGYIMVLPTSTSPALDLAAMISCEWRPGDAW